jgi:glycosyltransferase involved in cell wall biosynthesis
MALKAKADLYVVTRDGTRGEQVLERWGLTARSLVLRNGADVPEHARGMDPKQFRRQLGLDSGQHVITFVGRIESWKRPDRIIQVAHWAKKCGYPWIFVLAGPGGEKPILERRVKDYELQDIVRFVGAVPHAHVWQFLSASDVFLTLHDLSSLSNTLLEALAIGIPVVCSHKGDEIERLVIEGRSGYLVKDADNPVEIVEKVENALRISRETVLNSIRIESWESRLEREFQRIQQLLRQQGLARGVS